MKTATTGLGAASSQIINNHDQYEVFNDPSAVCRLSGLPRQFSDTFSSSQILLILS
jgi:hypothetical protein